METQQKICLNCKHSRIELDCDELSSELTCWAPQNTSGGKPCSVSTSMPLHELNFAVAWLQSELHNIDESICLIEHDCVELLCKFYGCSRTYEDWEQELNLCDNWDEYLCGPLCEQRKPFVEQFANAEARLALQQIALEIEAGRN